MREADFKGLLRQPERLCGERWAPLGRALASGEPESVRLLERAFAAVLSQRYRHCCSARDLRRWGHADRLRCYRYATSRKTFNALTGTSWARLRKKACWLAHGGALAAGMGPTKMAGCSREYQTT